MIVKEHSVLEWHFIFEICGLGLSPPANALGLAAGVNWRVGPREVTFTSAAVQPFRWLARKVRAGTSNRRVSGIDYWTVPEPDRDRPASGLGAKAVKHRLAIDDVQHRAPLVRGVN